MAGFYTNRCRTSMKVSMHSSIPEENLPGGKLHAFSPKKSKYEVNAI